MLVIGLMSGTSADGTDAVLVRISGAPPELKWRVVAYNHLPHPHDLREQIFTLFNLETSRVDLLCRLNFDLGRAFAQAALRVIEIAGATPDQVDLIGSHGQTLWHIPADQEGASTLQIGEPAVIAELTGIPVISSFRTRDMAAGGQGAPLVAYVDKLLLTDPVKIRAAQNIGGIANVTYLPPLSGGLGEAFAFDTGPGNMLIDDAARRASAGRLQYDQDGRLAAAGKIHPGLLEELLQEPYLTRKPPKTTGRELFGAQLGRQIWEKAVRIGLLPEDTLATLTAYTAETIARAYHAFLPAQPEQVIVSGGGARNPVLMHMLAEKLAPARLLLSDEVGLAVEAKEAVAFAILAYETWHGRPGNLPAATGASRPVVLGSITPAPDRSSSPQDLQTSLTESFNPRTADLDLLDPLEIAEIMNNEDALVAHAVSLATPSIGQAVREIAARMQKGGRLIYLGAGTSGRLGVLDASECPPTFGVDPGQVIGIIAGGERALRSAVEDVEDQAGLGEADLRKIQLQPGDSVVGITVSGSTPYVLGGLRYAREVGALTVALACNDPAAVAREASIAILVPVGPEVISGSSRLKGGTAQKMVLNMLSTGVMICLGKTYGNLMVDLKAGNAKLRGRALRLVQHLASLDEHTARDLLERCGWEVKTAVVCQAFLCSPEQSRQILAAHQGKLRLALGR
jgi:anhydro-N-acetylmuramic acid kinase